MCIRVSGLYFARKRARMDSTISESPHSDPPCIDSSTLSSNHSLTLQLGKIIYFKSQKFYVGLLYWSYIVCKTRVMQNVQLLHLLEFSPVCKIYIIYIYK